MELHEIKGLFHRGFPFDPRHGETVFAPPQRERAYWVGAPSVTYNPRNHKFYLYRRIRYPRPIRGGECRIAESDDGQYFDDIWSLKKEELDSPSIERAALIHGYEGDFFLYLSYVDPVDHRWRIDVMRALSPAEFNPADRKTVLTADSIGAQAVKDPVVYKIGGEYHLFYTYAPLPTGVSGPDKELYERMHKTADVFNTGLVTHHSGLAVGQDGENFEVIGKIISPSGQGWDSDTTRTTCLLWNSNYCIMFYDGKSSVEENYEEKCGYAISFDYAHWRRVTKKRPVLISPWGSGSLRYLDVIVVDQHTYFYYEICRPDGSHELRVNICNNNSG